MATPDYRLISPATIRNSAYLASPILGSALLIWDALLLSRLGLALAAALFCLVGSLVVRAYFVPTLTWLIGYLAAAWMVGRLAEVLDEDFQGHVYDGGRVLRCAPLVSFLCALQLLLVSSSVRHYKTHVTEVAESVPSPTVRPQASPQTGITAGRNPVEPVAKQGRRIFGPNTVDYRDVPASTAETLNTQLQALGFFTTRPDWAGVDMTPQAMRVSLLLPQGQRVGPAIDRRYQLAAESLRPVLNPGRPLQVFLLDQNRQPIKVYSAH